MPNQEHLKRRWPLRLIAAAPGCLVSAIFVAIQIPAVREAIGIAKTIYGFINSTVPSLGVAGIWIGFVLVVGGVIAAWRLHRTLKEGTTKTAAVGSAVLAVVLGSLVAVISTLSQPGQSSSTTPPSYEASIGRHHRSPRHHHHALTKRPSSGGSKARGTPSPAPPNPTSAPAPTPAPSPQPSGGGSSSSGGSGGNGNNVTVNKTNTPTVTSGDATGPNATSGPATSNNNEAVNISIG